MMSNAVAANVLHMPLVVIPILFVCVLFDFLSMVLLRFILARLVFLWSAFLGIKRRTSEVYNAQPKHDQMLNPNTVFQKHA